MIPTPITKNGSFVRGASRQSDVSGTAATNGPSVSIWLTSVTAVLEVQAGDFFEVRVFPGAARDVIDAPATICAMERVS
jgi:hypothetical protein